MLLEAVREGWKRRRSLVGWNGKDAMNISLILLLQITFNCGQVSQYYFQGCKKCRWKLCRLFFNKCFLVNKIDGFYFRSYGRPAKTVKLKANFVRLSEGMLMDVSSVSSASSLHKQPFFHIYWTDCQVETWQIDSMLLYVCLVLDHRWYQNVVRTKRWH